MFQGLHAAAKEVYEQLLEIRQELPWPDPRGGKLFVRLRPHDSEAFAAARKALGIEPAVTAERQKKATEKARAELVEKGRRQDMVTLGADWAGRMDRALYETSALALDFPTGRPYYTREEVAALRAAVALHLVVAVDREMDGEIIEETPGEEAAGAFLSELVIPHRWEPRGDDDLLAMFKAGNLSALANDSLAFAGEEEGIALAAVCLRWSMEDERFRRRLVPLESSCPTLPPGEVDNPATTE